jgi:hypothetical protein
MENDRKVVPAAEFARLSVQEQMKVNYAKVWDKKDRQVFAARAGTYRLEGNVIYTTRLIALQPDLVGLNESLTILHFDRKTIVWRTAPNSAGVAREVTLRRID